MINNCCAGNCNANQGLDNHYRKILWIALCANIFMFIIEIITGWIAGSTSLLADSMDFLGDAGNYGLSLFALGLSGIWRSRVALIKGYTMATYGLAVILAASLGIFGEHIPLASWMGVIGILALATNVSIALLLYKYRKGDSNMRSVWLCTRNDAIVNVAVILAAIGVAITHQRWPDMVVAICIGLLGLISGSSVIKHALMEIKQLKQAQLVKE